MPRTPKRAQRWPPWWSARMLVSRRASPRESSPPDEGSRPGSTIPAGTRRDMASSGEENAMTPQTLAHRRGDRRDGTDRRCREPGRQRPVVPIDPETTVQTTAAGVSDRLAAALHRHRHYHRSGSGPARHPPPRLRPSLPGGGGTQPRSQVGRPTGIVLAAYPGWCVFAAALSTHIWLLSRHRPQAHS